MPSLEFLSILRQAFGPTVTAYETLATVVQASADGYRLSVTYSDSHDSEDVGEKHGVDNVGDDSSCPNNGRNSGDSGNPSVVKEVFLKHVDAYKYAHTKTSFNDFRRTLMYLRTEVRF